MFCPKSMLWLRSKWSRGTSKHKIVRACKWFRLFRYYVMIFSEIGWEFYQHPSFKHNQTLFFWSCRCKWSPWWKSAIFFMTHFLELYASLPTSFKVIVTKMLRVSCQNLLHLLKAMMRLLELVSLRSDSSFL